jgi:hypothetical protein
MNSVLTAKVLELCRATPVPVLEKNFPPNEACLAGSLVA